jgi:hypothetical protein
MRKCVGSVHSRAYFKIKNKKVANLRSGAYGLRGGSIGVMCAVRASTGSSAAGRDIHRARHRITHTGSSPQQPAAAPAPPAPLSIRLPAPQHQAACPSASGCLPLSIRLPAPQHQAACPSASGCLPLSIRLPAPQHQAPAPCCSKPPQPPAPGPRPYLVQQDVCRHEHWVGHEAGTHVLALLA